MRALAVLILLTGLLPSVARAGVGKVTTVQLPDGLRVEEAAGRDINGDGNPDLVIAAATVGARPERSLRIHLCRAEEVCFRPQPDYEYRLVPGVVAFAVGDVERAPGSEIILFTAREAYA